MREKLRTPLLSLQAGRAVAAMAVLAFHLSISMGGAGFSAYGQKYTWRGDLGVDFFFVLSGFIIAYAHYNDIGNPQALGRYIWRRFARLYPIYWIFTAIVIVAFALVGRTSHPPSSPAEWLTALSLVRFSAAPTPIRPAWTLIHEIAFYLAFALIIVNRKFGWAAFGAWMLLCLVVYHYCGVVDRTPFRTYSSAINLNFALGMGAYGLYIRQWRPKLLMISGVLVFIATYIADSLSQNPSPLLYAAALAAIIAALAIFESQRALKVPVWLASIGNASYVLYLSHEFVCTLFLRVAHKFASHVSDGVIFATTFILSVLVSVALHKGLEQPLLSALKRKIA
jgi:peptidoglycan/LPS O-acetylase OafA/YrhL